MTDFPFEKFCAYLKQSRESREVTAKDLASRIGVAERTVYRWESTEVPSAHHLFLWARALNIDFHNFTFVFADPDTLPEHTMTTMLLRACAHVTMATDELVARHRHGTHDMPVDDAGARHLRLVTAAAHSLKAAAQNMVEVLTMGGEGDAEPADVVKACPDES